MISQNLGGAALEIRLPATDDEMVQYGITRIPVDYFHYHGFRYTNLKDAIEQAKRDGYGS